YVAPFPLGDRDEAVENGLGAGRDGHGRPVRGRKQSAVKLAADAVFCRGAFDDDGVCEQRQPEVVAGGRGGGGERACGEEEGQRHETRRQSRAGPDPSLRGISCLATPSHRSSSCEKTLEPTYSSSAKAILPQGQWQVAE